MIYSTRITLPENVKYFFSLINNTKYFLVSNNTKDDTLFFILIDNLVNCFKIENTLYLSTEASIINTNKVASLDYLIKKTICSLNKTFTKQLVLKGRGFKSNFNSNRFLKLKIGLSHLVELEIPKNIKISIKKNKITSKSKNLLYLNNFTSNILKLKKKDVYKGKGILMRNQAITLKPIKKK